MAYRDGFIEPDAIDTDPPDMEQRRALRRPAPEVIPVDEAGFSADLIRGRERAGSRYVARVPIDVPEDVARNTPDETTLPSEAVFTVTDPRRIADADIEKAKTPAADPYQLLLATGKPVDHNAETLRSLGRLMEPLSFLATEARRVQLDEGRGVSAEEQARYRELVAGGMGEHEATKQIFAEREERAHQTAEADPGAVTHEKLQQALGNQPLVGGLLKDAPTFGVPTLLNATINPFLREETRAAAREQVAGAALDTAADPTNLIGGGSVGALKAGGRAARREFTQDIAEAAARKLGQQVTGDEAIRVVAKGLDEVAAGTADEATKRTLAELRNSAYGRDIIRRRAEIDLAAAQAAAPPAAPAAAAAAPPAAAPAAAATPPSAPAAGAPPAGPAAAAPVAPAANAPTPPTKIEKPEFTPLADAQEQGILRQLPKYAPTTQRAIKAAVESDPVRWRELSKPESVEDTLRAVVDRTGADPEVLKRKIPDKGDLAATMAAGAITLDQKATRLGEIARRSGGTATDEYRTAFAEYVDLVMEVSEGSSELGRALNIQKLYKKQSYAEAVENAASVREAKRLLERAEKSGDAAQIEQARSHYLDVKTATEAQLSKARERLLERAVKEGVRKEHLEGLAKFTPDELVEMQRYLAEVLPMSRGEMIVSAFISNILSAPKTLMVNVLSSEISVLHDRMVHALQAGVVEPLLAKAQRREQEVFWEEVLPSALAWKQGFMPGVSRSVEAWLRASDTLAANPEVRASLAGRGPRLTREVAGKRVSVAAGDLFSLGSRNTVFGDVLVRYPAQEAYRTQLAVRKVVKDLKAAGTAPTPQNVAEGTAALLQDPAWKRSVASEVDAYGRRHAFSDQASPVTRKFASFIDTLALPRATPVLGRTPVARFVLPFINIADRLISRGVTFVPGVKLAEGAVRAARGEGEAASRALAEGTLNAVFSSLFGAVIVNKMAAGEITLSSPADENERREWESQGKLPYAVKIGDTWVEWGRLEPYTLPFKWIAAVLEGKEAKRDADWTAQAQEITGRLARSFSDASYLRGLNDLLYIAGNPISDRTSEVLERIAANTVLPGAAALGSVARTLDGTKAEPEGPLEAIQANIPFAASGVPDRLDIFGRPVRQPGGQILPARSIREEDHPVLNELARLEREVPGFPGVGIIGDEVSVGPSGSKQKMKLDRAQHRELEMLYGPMLEEALRDAVESEDYLEMNALERAQTVKAVERKIREAARQEFLGRLDERGQLPELDEAE